MVSIPHLVTITLPLYHSIYVYSRSGRTVASPSEGAYSYIRVLPNLKSIRFQKKFNCAKHEYLNMSTPFIDHSAGNATEVELQQTYRRFT